jgi:hypothetical protein
MAVERMILEGRSSPEDAASAENSVKQFIPVMKSLGIFIGCADRLDNVCFRAAHRRLKRWFDSGAVHTLTILSK